MRQTTTNLETLLQQKIVAYQNMVDLFLAEKKSLASADVDALWDFSDQKQSLASEIARIRTHILATLQQDGIHHGMDDSAFQLSRVLELVPVAVRKKLLKYQVSLMSCKQTIKTVAMENKRFIQEYLGILDELIGIITHTGKPDPLYDHRRHCHDTAPTNRLISREA